MSEHGQKSTVEVILSNAVWLSACAGSNPVPRRRKMKISPTNLLLRNVIISLDEASKRTKSDLWKRIAQDLSMASRQRRAVNLSRISFNTKEDEIIVVPGKVLGSGDISHKLTITAFSYSSSALEKLKKAGARVVSFEKLISENPKGNNIRIIG